MFLYNNDADGEFVDQSEKNEDYDQDFAYLQHEQYFPKTDQPKLNTQVQVDRYKTLMNLDADTKNIPKTFGNNFKKFMENQIQENQEYFQQNPIPQVLTNFIEKKKISKSADYTIDDFRQIFNCQQINQWFQFYVENVLFLDLITSNRIYDPEIYIIFIEQYLAGAKDPFNFISSRPIKEKKQIKKKTKLNEKLGIVQQLDNQFLQESDVVNENQENSNQIDFNQFSEENHKNNAIDVDLNNNYN